MYKLKIVPTLIAIAIVSFGLTLDAAARDRVIVDRSELETELVSALDKLDSIEYMVAEKTHWKSKKKLKKKVKRTRRPIVTAFEELSISKTYRNKHSRKHRNSTNQAIVSRNNMEETLHTVLYQMDKLESQIDQIRRKKIRKKLNKKLRRARRNIYKSLDILETAEVYRKKHHRKNKWQYKEHGQEYFSIKPPPMKEKRPPKYIVNPVRHESNRRRSH